jgi:hypothetical protein
MKITRFTIAIVALVVLAVCCALTALAADRYWSAADVPTVKRMALGGFFVCLGCVIGVFNVNCVTTGEIWVRNRPRVIRRAERPVAFWFSILSTFVFAVLFVVVGILAILGYIGRGSWR